MEKVRPGTGREAGLGHAGGRATQGAVAEGSAGYEGRATMPKALKCSRNAVARETLLILMI